MLTKDVCICMSEYHMVEVQARICSGTSCFLHFFHILPCFWFMLFLCSIEFDSMFLSIRTGHLIALKKHFTPILCCPKWYFYCCHFWIIIGKKTTQMQKRQRDPDLIPSCRMNRTTHSLSSPALFPLWWLATYLWEADKWWVSWNNPIHVP